MKDFTFYDIYYTAIKQLSDEEAGKFIKRICAYTVFETEDIPSKEDDTNTVWEIIYPTLEAATETERLGKIPYYLNRRMSHFTFKNAYARIMQSQTDNKKAGKLIKAICEYMYYGTEPTDLPPPTDGHFQLLRKSFDVSRTRKEVGKKGGKTKKTVQKTMSFSEFMSLNPHIEDTVYKAEMKENRDWNLLNEKLKTKEKWKTEKSLYILLKNYDEIIG